MTVTVTTNTISARARYLNVSASTANADAKDVILAMANALIALGWSRYDTLGATEVIGTADNAGVILRRACYDTAQSSHFNYLGLRLVGSGTNTYTFHMIQAADWTGTTSMSNFVSAAAVPSYTPNTTGRTRFLNFAQGGTIWIFDSGKTLLLTTQSGVNLTKSVESTWIVGEYKKEFGENVNAATEYIHNGVFTCDRWLLDGCGVAEGTANNGFYDNFISIPGIVGHTGQSIITRSNSVRTDYSSTIYNTQRNQSIRTGTGAGYAQFSLTEAPSIGTSVNSVTATRSAIAPASVREGFTTRLMMGYMGYIGHINSLFTNSINSEFLGHFNATPYNDYSPFVAPTTLTSRFGTQSYDFGMSSGNTSGNNLFNSRGQYTYPLISAIQEFSPATLPTNLLFTVFEPTLSCGTTNGISNQLNSQQNTLSYTGPQYKFSLLGRIFDLKIFGPFTSEKYVFLDSIAMPCNADGFFAEGGASKEFWIIPTGNHMAFLMPK